MLMAQVQEQTKIADPQTRRINTAVAGTLINKTANPERVYRLASPQDETQGLQFHLDIGWKKVNGRKDCDPERLVSGRVDPDGTVSFRGQVLLWLPKEENDALMGERKSLLSANEVRRNSGPGLDGVTDALGNPAQNDDNHAK
jgi:hypothetical protein